MDKGRAMAAIQAGICSRGRVGHLLLWVLVLCPKSAFGTRWSTLKSIWFTTVKSMAEYQMGNYGTTQEFIDELHRRARFTVDSTALTLTGQILVTFSDTPIVLYGEPTQKDRYQHGAIEHGSFDLTIDQAEYLAELLIKAAKNSRKFERDCQKT